MTPFTPNTPGIFRMPAADYHAAPGVGKHSLDYVAKSPLDYALHRKYGMEPTEAMEQSTLCHTAVLEPELFKDAFHLRPGMYPDEKGNLKKWTGASNWCKDWLSAHEDKPVVTQTELVKIQNAAKCVREHPICGPMFEHGAAEMSIFAPCPLTGLLRKGRPDWITTSDDEAVWIVETKFVADASENAFLRQVEDLRYYVQHPYYVDLWVIHNGGNPDELETTMRNDGSGFQTLRGVPIHFIFIAVEKEPMHEKSEIHRVQPYELHPACVELGRRHYIRDLRRYMDCMERGEWPSDTDKIKPLALSSWVMKQGAI